MKNCKELKKEFLSKKFRNRLSNELGNICVNCGSDEYIHYHHIVPLGNGGSNNITNIVPLCENCHGMVHMGKSYECLRNGTKTAKEKNGYKDGRPDKYTKEEKDYAMKLKEDGYSYSQIVKMTGISKSTLIRYNRKKTL